MTDDEAGAIPAFVIRAVPPEADLSGAGGWVPEGEDEDEADVPVEEENPVGEDVGGDRPD